jgi:hypothetical protein
VKHKKRTIQKTTFGSLSLALFSFVILTGILLAIPFDVKEPYRSISIMLVGNPWASLIRNLHFWSAQLFLVFSLIHLYDHFHHKEKIGLKRGMAIRLSLGVLIIFLAMLTGFLLKGDADSLQARQILQSLTERIPLVGKAFAFSLLGPAGSYQLIYVHHIATFSIFISIIIFEHSRKFWPQTSDFILTFFVLLALSWFFTAPLHDGMNPSVKGPWYFVGFQEILHWLSHPEWSLLLILILLVFIYIVNTGKNKEVFISKRSLLVLTAFYLILTVIGLFFRGENWQWTSPTQANYTYSVLNNFKSESLNFNPVYSESTVATSPFIKGRKESCLLCHNQVHGFTDAHKPEAIGCFSCHGGNPFATRKAEAHKNMIRIPGNLATARQSCGTTGCHTDISERIQSGLMTSLSGMISVDRFVFGEQDNPDRLTHVHQLAHSAADEHLKNLCVRCHLGNPKENYGPVNEKSRGGGCLACHLNYENPAKNALEKHQQQKTDTSYLNLHPAISLQVNNQHCFGCHSRSGRISTNYEGWHETVLEPEQMPDSSNYRLVEDTRVFKKEPDDIHHKLGMDCIDCHHSYELMGDGKKYAHEEEQQDVQCKDCHFNGKPFTTQAKDLDYESAVIAALRFGNITGKQFLTTHKHHHALINTFVSGDSAFLITKNSKKLFYLKAPAQVCSRNQAHQNLACSSCHSSWAPSCIGCHNTYDRNEPGYDMIKNREKKGSWVEYTGRFDAKLPALGIRTTSQGKEIIPVVPGMILTIDRASYTKKAHDSLLFRRLFAPAAPHTTATKGRSCKSCHNNPVALGYGEGSLQYLIKNGKGKWTFEPLFDSNPHDGLPEDAWTGFLQSRTGMVSTRKNVKPFSIEEQKRMLLVGACLTCHKDHSNVMQKSLNHFDKLLNNRSDRCILPDWK